MAGSSKSTKCKTKYPVVFAHGMFATDKMLGFIDYWWGVKDAVEDKSATVYMTAVNCMDSTANKALQFKYQYLQILAINGSSKANIIGHSHGGMYTRYAITNLGLAPKVASLTSVCSPHRGSSAADTIFNIIPNPFESLIGSAVDVLYVFIMGDSNPNSIENGIAVTRDYCNNIFNPNTPNVSGLYYQSYATKIKWLTADLILEPLWVIIKYYEGDNDGLVSVNSAKWGNFRGVESGAWWSGGVSHINAIGHFFGLTPGFSAGDYYVDMIADLKNRGF